MLKWNFTNSHLYYLHLGTCGVLPLSGIALSTNFTFICEGWTDLEPPLTYEFSYGNNQTETLFYYRTIASDMLISHTDWLPPGEKSSNYTLTVTVKVKDSYGSHSSEKFSVQVSEHMFRSNGHQMGDYVYMKDKKFFEFVLNFIQQRDRVSTPLVSSLLPSSGSLSPAAGKQKARNYSSSLIPLSL